MDLGIPDRHLDRGMLALAGSRLRSRTPVALPGGRPPGHLHRRRLFSPSAAALGLIGLVSLFPILGSKWAQRLEKRPNSTRRCLPRRRLFPARAGPRRGRISLWLAPRDGRGGWGLVDTRTDPTLDLYGWDQVADRIKQLGLLDDPKTFVFTSYWYQSAHFAHELGRERRGRLL